MVQEVSSYLEQVRRSLRLDATTERRVMHELSDHFEEQMADLEAKGFSELDAASTAIASFGRARVVARLMYEAYSRGSWVDTVLAALPLALLAVLFVTHAWQNLLILQAFLAVIVSVSLFGWWHGKPTWLYSWVGCSLLPVLVGACLAWPVLEQAGRSAFSDYVDSPGLLLVLTIICIFVSLLWTLAIMTIRVAKRDWILASVMLVCLPIVGCWLFNIVETGGIGALGATSAHKWDGQMARALLALAATAAAFVRLRRRTLKIASVVLIGPAVLMTVVNSLWEGLGFFQQAGWVVFMATLLLIPTWLEARLGHAEQPDGWHPPS
jgi:hypothetical protein